MYPNDLIETLRSRVNVVRLIGEVIPLKRSGRAYVGLCPFHGEKTPSFSVSEDKQLFHCFGCGAGGSVYQFVMQYYHLSFKEAVERIAAGAGMDLSAYQQAPDRKAQELKAEKERLYQLNDYVCDRYMHGLAHPTLGQAARAYAHQRRLSDETLQAWRIGYAPEGWDHLVKAMERDGQSKSLAKSLGLVGLQRDGQAYDTFRQRLMFPIRDLSGRVVGFGGRALGDGKPKYLNSAQSVLFDKSKTLYGIYEAQEALRSKRHALVVEGYMDALALVQAGFPQTVATLGTALTVAHADLLRRLADRVTLVFDGDAAGTKAAVRSLKPLLSQGLAVSVVFLPNAVDPDEFVCQNGPEALQTLVDDAPSLLHTFIQEYYLKTSDTSVKARALETLAELVRETPYVFVREALIHDICALTKVSPAVLKGEKPTPAASSAKPRTRPNAAPRAQSPLELFMLLRLALEIPEAKVRLCEDETLQDLLGPELHLGVLEYLEKTAALVHTDSTLASYVDAWPIMADHALLTKVMMEDLPSAQAKWQTIWDDCLRRLQDRKIKLLRTQLREAEQAQRFDEVDHLTKRVQELKTHGVSRRKA